MTSFMKMLISFSSRTWHLPTLPKVPKAGSMTMLLLCLIGQQTRLTWAPQRIYGVLSRGRWETPDPTMQMTWRPLSKQPGLPLHLSSATGWLPPYHAALMQSFMQKEAQPNIECIEINILFRGLTFLFKIYIFLLILCNILIIWDTDFGVFIICKP